MGSIFYRDWVSLGSRWRLLRLLEVLAHEALEIEVGELVCGLQGEELLELRVRVDLAAVVGVLELVGADVRVDFAGHFRPRNERPLGLRQEICELVTDKGWLYKAARGAARRLVLALGACLLSSLGLSLSALLEGLEVDNDGRHLGAHRREL